MSFESWYVELAFGVGLVQNGLRQQKPESNEVSGLTKPKFSSKCSQNGTGESTEHEFSFNFEMGFYGLSQDF